MPLLDGSSSPVTSSQPKSKRSYLRQASFILPKTGQRLKGFIDLRSRHWSTSINSEERRPLLSHHHGVTPRPQRAFVGYYNKVSAIWERICNFLTSDLGKGVLKCSLAYLLGSLATFIPAISALLGHQDGKHLVATITVYFHPARSKGSMLKALICAFLAFLYAAFVSITSMCVATVFQDTLGLLILLVVCCGGGLGFVGWTKQRLNDPLVNVACSLTSLAIISVLTKEEAVQEGSLSFTMISKVLKMLVMGVCATMAVSFLIFPISARQQLRLNLITMNRTIAKMLGIITEGFLGGVEEELRGAEFTNVFMQNKKAYGQLDKLLKESKLEHYVVGTEKQYRLEKRLVRSVQDITQNLGGLQSAASLQFQLLKQTSNCAMPLHGPKMFTGKIHSSFSSSIFSEEPVILASATEMDDQEFLDGDEQLTITPQHEETEVTSMRSPRDAFEIFINHLGPSMRSLAFTLKEIFEEVPFSSSPNYRVSFNRRYLISLESALELYQSAREDALVSIYRRKSFSKIKSPETEADLEEVAASCGHFSFSLLEFGEQLKDLLIILDELQLEEEHPTGRSWNWLKFWHLIRVGQDAATAPRNERSISACGVDAISTTDNTQNRNHDKCPGAYQNRLGYRIWRALSFFRRDETKFALKVGAGAALYALPSFLSSTRPIYSAWRGEWGLLSYMLVCSMTIGASNTTGLARFFGTCLGAFCAVASWYITVGNVFGLAFLGWLMATWTAYIILAKGQGPMGRFIMLTYNLSVLYAYSLSRKDDDNDEDEGGINPIITEIALHRVVAVLSGCIWGIVITRFIWPISARKKLKEGLSLLWLQLSLIWKRNPLSTMADGKATAAYLTSREKLKIERFFSRLESLQAAAGSELELKGPFPDVAYQNILNRTRSMLNAFYAMNLEVLKNLKASEGEVSLLRYTCQERQQLTARVSHLLSVLASSMKLEYPLNDVLPSIGNSRDRLLARIFRYRRDRRVSHLTGDGDYALLYAYVLVTGQLSAEIVEVNSEISGLFGVLEDDVIDLH